MLFLNDCICTWFDFGCVVVKRCKKERRRGQTVERIALNTVVYKAELDFIDPRPLDWTHLDCTDALVVLGFKNIDD